MHSQHACLVHVAGALAELARLVVEQQPLGDREEVAPGVRADLVAAAVVEPPQARVGDVEDAAVGDAKAAVDAEIDERCAHRVSDRIEARVGQLRRVREAEAFERLVGLRREGKGKGGIVRDAVLAIWENNLKAISVRVPPPKVNTDNRDCSVG